MEKWQQKWQKKTRVKLSFKSTNCWRIFFFKKIILKKGIKKKWPKSTCVDPSNLGLGF